MARGETFGGLGRAALALGFALSALVCTPSCRSCSRRASGPDRPDARLPERTGGGGGKTQACARCLLGRNLNYATTGRKLAYELRGKAPVVQLDERIRLHLPPVDLAVLRCPALYVELERRSAPALLAPLTRYLRPGNIDARTGARHACHLRGLCGGGAGCRLALQ